MTYISTEFIFKQKIMNLIYGTKLQLGLLIFTFLLINNFMFGQSVEPPVLLNTESNGVKFYSSNGVENNIQQTPFVPATQPIIKSIDDYTLEEINNMLIDLDYKLQLYQNENNQEAIDLLLAYQILLIEQKTILSNQN